MEATEEVTWEFRLRQALDRGHFSREEMDLAGDWLTCAVGEADKSIGHNGPVDPELDRLGILFFHTVQKQRENIYEAIDIRHQILERVEWLEAAKAIDKENVQA